MQLGKRKKKKTILRHTILFTYSSRGWGKKASQWLAGDEVRSKEGGIAKGALSKVWGMTDIFFILTVVMVSPVYKDVKFDQIVIKYVQLLYFNNTS